MSDAVTIALISALALILSGVLVELVRARRSVESEFKPNHGNSLRDQVDAIRRTVGTLDERQRADHDRIIELTAITKERQGAGGSNG
ncbi:MAG: hypothetical protein ACREMQ_00595 [Longimicrobiales bacterium]